MSLKNEGKTQHTFTIDVLGVDQTLNPDQKATVTVTLPASGATNFYCRFHGPTGYQPGHAGRLLLQEGGHRDDGWSRCGIGGIRADAHDDRLDGEPRRDGLRLLSPVTLGLGEGVSAG